MARGKCPCPDTSKNASSTLRAVLEAIPEGALIALPKGEIILQNKKFSSLVAQEAISSLKNAIFLKSRKANSGKHTFTLSNDRQLELQWRMLKLNALSAGAKLLTLKITAPENGTRKKELEKLQAKYEKLLAKHSSSLEKESARSRRLESIVREIDERERERLGRELHDMMGQTLTTLAISCEVLKNRLVVEGSQHSLDATSLLDKIRLLMGQTRSLSRQLFPVSVESRGIEEPLQELAGSLRVSLGIDCNCRFKGQKLFSALDAEAKINIFRIAQEAVSNAIKHGGARKIAIALELGNAKGALSIRNNGTPFEKEAAKGDGIGISIMKSRAEMLGGSLKIASVRKNGALVRCIFPLKELKKRRN